MRVVPAPARCRVEQPAADVGEENPLGLLLFELDEATAPAAVAEALPLGIAHLIQALGPPEWNIHHRSPPDPPASASLQPFSPGFWERHILAVSPERSSGLSSSSVRLCLRPLAPVFRLG